MHVSHVYVFVGLYACVLDTWTHPAFATLFLLTSMVVMECFAPDCTSQSTFHWAFFDFVWSRFTPSFALTLQKHNA